MMTTNSCPECGRELAGNDVEGLRAACLLARGMVSMGESAIVSEGMSNEGTAAIPVPPG